MISGPDAYEAVITERCARTFGYENLADAVGKTLEFLSPPNQSTNGKKNADDEVESFFGIPLGEEDSGDSDSGALVARTFRIAGVLKTEIKEGPEQGGLRGLMPGGGIYIPLHIAHEWDLEHRSSIGEVALELARSSGKLGQSQNEGYNFAVVRVKDPVALTEVRKRLTRWGLEVFRSSMNWSNCAQSS